MPRPILGRQADRGVDTPPIVPDISLEIAYFSARVLRGGDPPRSGARLRFEWAEKSVADAAHMGRPIYLAIVGDPRSS